jgi:hypothetical protein
MRSSQQTPPPPGPDTYVHKRQRHSHAKLSSPFTLGTRLASESIEMSLTSAEPGHRSICWPNDLRILTCPSDRPAPEAQALLCILVLQRHCCLQRLRRGTEVNTSVGVEDFTLLTMKNAVFWYVAQRGFIRNWRFGGTCRLDLQDRRNNASEEKCYTLLTRFGQYGHHKVLNWPKHVMGPIKYIFNEVFTKSFKHCCM